MSKHAIYMINQTSRRLNINSPEEVFFPKKNWLPHVYLLGDGISWGAEYLGGGEQDILGGQSQGQNILGGRISRGAIPYLECTS